MNPHRVLIVEDEPLTRRGLCRSLEAMEGFELAGEARDGPEAVGAILGLHPDLVLLDVQIPGFDGFEVLARVRDTHLPGVIFVSAYDHYAIRAFDAHAVDYVLKPYTEERFREALHRARARLEHPDPAHVAKLLSMVAAAAPPGTADRFVDRFTVRERQGWRIVRLEDVHWFESAGNYVELHTADATHLIRMTMAGLERALDPRRFARIHRTTVVNVDQVSEVIAGEGDGFRVMLRSGQALRMSRRLQSRLIP